MNALPNSQFSDPSQFILPWDTVFEQLSLIILLSFLIERLLAQLFELDWFVEKNRQFKKAGRNSIKPMIASIASIAVTVIYKIDILATLTSLNEPSLFGCLATGLIIAGGSKASIKLFHDFLDVKSSAYRAYETEKKTPKTTDDQG